MRLYQEMPSFKSKRHKKNRRARRHVDMLSIAFHALRFSEYLEESFIMHVPVSMPRSIREWKPPLERVPVLPDERSEASRKINCLSPVKTPSNHR